MDWMQFFLRITKIIRNLNLKPVNIIGKWILEKLPLLPFPTGESIITFDGFKICYSPKEHFYPNIFALATGRYESFAIDLFKKSIRPGMVVLDIGAHLGFYTLLAARQVGSIGQVYAFEPDPRSLSCLKHSIQKNGFIERVTFIPKAVSDRSTKEKSFYLRKQSGTSSLFKEESWKTKAEFKVEVTTIDDFLDDSLTIDVVKMDIEGAEIQALKGMRQTLRRSSQNLVMFVELNPVALRASRAHPCDLVELLRELGFQVKLINERKKELTKLGSNIESNLAKMPKEFANLYCRRNNNTNYY